MTCAGPAQKSTSRRPRTGVVLNMPHRKRWLLLAIYFFATVQFVWCYLWLTRPYVNTLLYEYGRERMPFQGRCLMMLPMRLAHRSAALHALGDPLSIWRFWFPRPVQPEVLTQGFIYIVCLLTVGILTTRIYQASSSYRLLTPVIYPLVLIVCGVTYLMHTVQNFRFIYDLPSLAFFSVAMYLIYFRRHWSLFVGTFLIATLNRETTLLLIPLYLIDSAVVGDTLQWKRILRPRTIAVVLPLLLFWGAWEVAVRHIFGHNRSEFYPRLDWNVKSLLAPLAWPQLISACGYLLPFLFLMRRRIPDARLRKWLWLFPIWILFMFVYGILVETRVFGELIPLVVCSAALLSEQLLVSRLRLVAPAASIDVHETSAPVSRAA